MGKDVTSTCLLISVECHCMPHMMGPEHHLIRKCLLEVGNNKQPWAGVQVSSAFEWIIIQSVSLSDVKKFVNYHLTLKSKVQSESDSMPVRPAFWLRCPFHFSISITVWFHFLTFRNVFSCCIIYITCGTYLVKKKRSKFFP